MTDLKSVLRIIKYNPPYVSPGLIRRDRDGRATRRYETRVRDERGRDKDRKDISSTRRFVFLARSLSSRSSRPAFLFATLDRATSKLERNNLRVKLLSVSFVLFER